MDYRLIAVDMDGTFLDGDGKIPPGFPGLLDRLEAAGVAFAPASGRQLQTLTDMFGPLGGELSLIAENGAVVSHRGQITSTTPLDAAVAHRVIDAVAGYNAARAHAERLWLVVCTPRTGFVDDPEAARHPEAAKYYHALELVDSLHRIADSAEVIKLAVYCPDDVEQECAPLLRRAADSANVAVSGRHWVDVMDPAADKGVALRELAGHLGCSRGETLAFGDYLNDYELLEAAGTSYAMANAHPELKAIADHIAPPNTEHGVVQVLEALLDGDAAGA